MSEAEHEVGVAIFSAGTAEAKRHPSEEFTSIEERTLTIDSWDNRLCTDQTFQEISGNHDILLECRGRLPWGNTRPSSQFPSPERSTSGCGRRPSFAGFRWRKLFETPSPCTDPANPITGCLPLPLLAQGARPDDAKDDLAVQRVWWK